jgi:hypothetical protein
MPLRSLREPDSAQPIRKWLLCQALFGVPFETSKTFRSAVLAVSSSRIKKLSEYMILKAFLLRSPCLYLSVSKVTQPPKRSESKPGLSEGWYQLSSSKFAACWLVGTGLINLALIPVPVEEQLVARTTVVPKATASNASRLVWSQKAPEH